MGLGCVGQDVCSGTCGVGRVGPGRVGRGVWGWDVWGRCVGQPCSAPRPPSNTRTPSERCGRGEPWICRSCPSRRVPHRPTATHIPALWGARPHIPPHIPALWGARPYSHTYPCPMGRLAPYLPLTSLCYDAPTAPHIPALWCTQPYSPTYPCPMGHPAPHPYPMGRPTPYPPPRHPCPMTHPQPHISLPYGAPGSTAPHIPALWGTPPHSPIHPSPPIPPL